MLPLVIAHSRDWGSSVEGLSDFDLTITTTHVPGVHAKQEGGIQLYMLILLPQTHEGSKRCWSCTRECIARAGIAKAGSYMAFVGVKSTILFGDEAHLKPVF